MNLASAARLAFAPAFVLVFVAASAACGGDGATPAAPAVADAALTDASAADASVADDAAPADGPPASSETVVRVALDGHPITFTKVQASVVAVGGGGALFDFYVEASTDLPEPVHMLLNFAVTAGTTNSVGSCANRRGSVVSGGLMFTLDRGEAHFEAGPNNHGDCAGDFAQIPATGLGRLVGAFTGSAIGVADGQSLAVSGTLDVDVTMRTN